MLGVTIPVRGAVGFDVRTLEQSEVELRAQHARDGGIDHRIGNEAALKRVEIRPVLRPRGLEDHVEARVERILRRGRRGRFGVMQDRRATGRRGIGDDEPSESPVALQLVREQRATLRRRRRRRRSCRQSSPIARAPRRSPSLNGGKNSSSSVRSLRSIG